MPFLKFAFILFVFFPTVIFGQTIAENLNFINAQFKQFNKYDTSFDVDQLNQKLICRDKFGMYSAFLKDIEIKKDSLSNSIGVFCHDGLKCISSLNKDGSEGDAVSEYTMGLSQNGTLVSTTEEVLEKFSTIKKMALEDNFVVSNPQTKNLSTQEIAAALELAPQNSLDQQLNYINNQFKKYNQYNTRFFVDVEKRELIWLQNAGKTRANIDDIEFNVDIENAWILISCKDRGSKCISFTSQQGTKMDYNEYSMALKENDQVIPHLEDVVEKFRALATAVLD